MIILLSSNFKSRAERIFFIFKTWSHWNFACLAYKNKIFITLREKQGRCFLLLLFNEFLLQINTQFEAQRLSSLKKNKWKKNGKIIQIFIKLRHTYAFSYQDHPGHRNTVKNLLLANAHTPPILMEYTGQPAYSLR